MSNSKLLQEMRQMLGIEEEDFELEMTPSEMPYVYEALNALDEVDLLDDMTEEEVAAVAEAAKRKAKKETPPRGEKLMSILRTDKKVKSPEGLGAFIGRRKMGVAAFSAKAGKASGIARKKKSSRKKSAKKMMARWAGAR